MKIISRIFLAVILMVSLLPTIPAQAAGNAIMRLTSAKTSYYVGDTVYVDIEVETNGESINTVRSLLNFSGSDVLLINDFRLGTAWPNLSPGKVLDNTADTINVGGFILVESVSSNSLFGTLIFKANQIGSSAINFATGSHLISPDQVEKINLAGCQGITINVIGTPPPPPPPPPQNQAPIFQPVNNVSITKGQAVNFNVQATDPDSADKITLTWNLPAGSSFNNVINNQNTVSGQFSWTPDTEGVYTLIFTATDDNQNSKAAVLTVSIGVSVPLPPVNHAPVFIPIPEKVANADELLTFNVTASDPDNDQVALSMDIIDTATFSVITTGPTSTGRFNWTPKNSGIYYAIFTATDDKQTPLSSNLRVRISIFGGACPPCANRCPTCNCTDQDYRQNSAEQGLPIITSPTHPNQDKWYSKNTPKFEWEVYKEGLGYAYNLDQKNNTDPSSGYYFSEDKSFTYSEIADGFWYFHLKTKYDDGWGPTAHYQVKIDTTPPEFFKPIVEKEIKNGQVTQDLLVFSAIDQLSGLAYFEMKIDQGQWLKVQSPVVLNNLAGTGKILTLRAVDNAGNAIENYVDLPTLKVDPKPGQSYQLEQPPVAGEPETPKPGQPEKIEVLAPVIDQVLTPGFKGAILIKNVFTVIGHSQPNAKITLFLEGDNGAKITFKAEANKYGYWIAYLEKALDPANYSLAAMATLESIDSQLSEKVYFTLLKPLIPTTQFKLTKPVLYGITAGSLSLLALILLLIKYIAHLKLLIAKYISRLNK